MTAPIFICWIREGSPDVLVNLYIFYNNTDPYCIISFCGTTSLSKTVQSSITPKWHQTIALTNIKQYVKSEAIDDEGSPFTVVIQIYDKDKFVRYNNNNTYRKT